MTTDSVRQEKGDTIYRQDAIDAIEDCAEFIKDIHQLVTLIDADTAKTKVRAIPSAQPEDWMERNKERILQAGMEGREIEFQIGGRLFAIREKAQ